MKPELVASDEVRLTYIFQFPALKELLVTSAYCGYYCV